MLFNGYFELKNNVFYRINRPEVWNTQKIPFKIIYLELYSNVRFFCPIVWILWKANWYLTFLIAICWFCFDRTIHKNLQTAYRRCVKIKTPRHSWSHIISTTKKVKKYLFYFWYKSQGFLFELWYKFLDNQCLKI